MENYIVRVYRRDASDPEAVVGVLENVETSQRHTFHSLNKLCRMLADPELEETLGAAPEPGAMQSPATARSAGS